MKRTLTGALLTSALLLAGCGGGGTGAILPSATSATAASSDRVPTEFQREIALGHFAASCGAAGADEARCFAWVLTPSGLAAAQGRRTLGKSSPNASSPSGYGPSQLQTAYGIATAVQNGLASGSHPVVAIVDAYHDPYAEKDLGVYRSQFGLPACTKANGCFRQVNQNGVAGSYPRSNASWSQEISLDLDMVSANCPSCDILLVEASSASFTNLGTAVNTAVKLGAVAVSNSYGGSESSGEVSTMNSYYDHPNVTITASNGDSGYGAQSPAAFNTLTAVGGTTLSSSGGVYSESVWSGSGSGCSAYVSKPSWQSDPSCGNRMIGDVAYEGDPNTGVAVYDSYSYQGMSGWLVFGGTSVGAPAIASIYALAGNATGQTVSAVDGYSNASQLHDVTSGSNGSCSTAYYCAGETGYDGPTGNGTPNGTGAF